MHSLFEEQLIHEQMAAHRFLDSRTDLDAEARSFLPASEVFAIDAEPYLAELDRLRRRVDVPVLASLNGTTPGGWTSYARRLENAGADALELNLYDVATSPDETGAAVEERQLEVVRSVVGCVRLPVTVKLSSFYASVPSFVRRLEQAGARGVTVFNRFYQPDVSLDTLDVDRRLVLSTSAELPCGCTPSRCCRPRPRSRSAARAGCTRGATRPRRSSAARTRCSSRPCCSSMDRSASG